MRLESSSFNFQPEACFASLQTKFRAFWPPAVSQNYFESLMNYFIKQFSPSVSLLTSLLPGPRCIPVGDGANISRCARMRTCVQPLSFGVNSVWFFTPGKHTTLIALALFCLWVLPWEFHPGVRSAKSGAEGLLFPELAYG